MASKYPEIKKYIIQQIKNNSYKEGEMLPPERELTDFFKASRMTVRRALDELISEGILIRKRGSGVIVAYKKQERSYDKVSFKKDKDLIEKYGSIETKVLELKLINNNMLTSRIFGDSFNEIYQLKRVQYGKQVPLVYENLFFKKEYFEDLFQIDCSQSMSDILKQTLLIEINNETIQLDSKIASKKVATILQIPIGSPILQITSIQKNNDDVIYFGINCINGDDFNYVITNKK